MARVLIYFLFLLSLFSCRQNQGKAPAVDYSGFNEKQVLLIGFTKEIQQTDTLGSLSIKIPTRLDTFYQWHRTTDYFAGGWLQYRFADKRYSQFAEGGFFWTVVPDSVYQVTIRHEPLGETPDSIVIRPLKESDTAEVWFSQSPNLGYGDIHYLDRKFRLINNRPFLIFTFIAMNGYLTKEETLFVTTATTLKDRLIFIIGECGTKDTAGFSESMYKSIRSIKIQEK